MRGARVQQNAPLKRGYTTRSRQAASELRNPRLSPLVVKYIGDLRAEVQEKYGITFDKHVGELAKLRDDARNKGAWAARIFLFHKIIFSILIIHPIGMMFLSLNTSSLLS
jgi:hypothetical protein